MCVCVCLCVFVLCLAELGCALLSFGMYEVSVYMVAVGERWHIET